MKRRAAVRRKRAKLTRHLLDRVRAAPFVRELMPVGGDELPDEVLGWRDSGGRIRRVQADYPNGWRVMLRIDTLGRLTKRSASLHLVSEVKGATS